MAADDLLQKDENGGGQEDAQKTEKREKQTISKEIGMRGNGESKRGREGMR